ncbi:MAG: phenylalanine--tRNA ligase subunit alpha [Rickettsiales bacterium]|nr:phenylalanine--tRNA ligase subunit alpha [Rickettsiales bacterium]
MANAASQDTAGMSGDSLAASLSALEGTTLTAIESASSPHALQELRVEVLGKKGSLTSQLKALGGLAPQERKTVGQLVNTIKTKLEAGFDNRRTALEEAVLEERLSTEKVDITLPARDKAEGSLHPITATIEEIITFFGSYGFHVEEGPDIEDDFHNFTALNIAESHPARQMHDTFYLQGEEGAETHPVLRTHTSPVQIRSMLQHGAPLRVLAPGSTYRCDSDQTHTPMFHQVEGIAIDKGIHMGHLKGMLIAFLESFFGVKDLPIRFRPSYFPFTEPSAEVDIGCTRKGGSLEIGSGDDWLEILGCGMVHPNVLKSCDLDPEEWQGFAFGMGVERLAMLKYGITDLRTFFDGDIRWLEHYGFTAKKLTEMRR